MAVAILMPALSPTMTEGNLAKWCKNIGDEIKSGDIIAEVETDKATMEIEAVDEGVLEKVLFDDGAEGITVNSLIAVLRNKNDSDKDVKDLLTKHNIDITANQNDQSDENNNEKNDIRVIPEKKEVLEESLNNKKIHLDVSDSFKTSSNENKNIKDSNTFNEDNSSTDQIEISRKAISPLAKRIAIQNNLDINLISGTGPRGRIIKDDVKNYLNKNSSLNQKHYTKNKEDVRKKPSSMRKVIAERLSYSKKEVPHFYLTVDCNVDELLKGRHSINKDLEVKEKISINDIVIKALGMALYIVPEANCSWKEDEITYYGSVDISVAVAVDDGLFTPVLKNVDFLKLSEISAKMKDFVVRANSGKLLPNEYEGGNFSISNLGMYEINNFSAIINPPQSGILAVGSITKKPIIINDEIKIANMMTCQLSGDHRVIDGAVGAKLLKEFKSIIENPIKMIV